MAPGAQERHVNRGNGGHAAGHGHAPETALKLGHRILEDTHGGVPKAGVDEPVALAGEAVRSVTGVPEGEGGGLVNGRVHRHEGIGLLSAVDKHSVESRILLHERPFRWRGNSRKLSPSPCPRRGVSRRGSPTARCATGRRHRGRPGSAARNRARYGTALR